MSGDSVWTKVRRNVYLIVSISLITHSTSIVYSLLTFREYSAGFVSIITSSVVCFLVSSSHLTIYGISILGSLYITLLQPLYPRHQLYYILLLSGLLLLTFQKTLNLATNIFRCFPGRIHASMVLGVSLIILSKFFPLAIENTQAFFLYRHPLYSPFYYLRLLFNDFRLLTLTLTVAAVFGITLLRSRLKRVPLIGILVCVGVLCNMKHYFRSYSDLCLHEGVQCTFYVINFAYMRFPALWYLVESLPAAALLTVILLFEQFLYLEEFSRSTQNEGLGEVSKESKTLGVANLISGCLGGLPICINLFATYEHFTFNQRLTRKATKWVGLLQVPFSYCLYSILSHPFNSIPLFVLFAVVATPLAYYLYHLLLLHRSHFLVICSLALITLLSHPLFALVIASFLSVIELASLLQPAPAYIILPDLRSSRFSTVSRSPILEILKSDFIYRVPSIPSYWPPNISYGSCLLYRIVGSLHFMNCNDHFRALEKSLNQLLEYNRQFSYILTTTPIILSFRYTPSADEYSLYQLVLCHAGLKEKGALLFLTGLYDSLLRQMESIPFYNQLLQQQNNTVFKLTS